ncbi:MAG: hypothetical protein ABWW66_07190 [Archaeoglobaceae archaeon]
MDLSALLNFLDKEDEKYFKAVSKDPIVAHSIKKIFERPEKAPKYMIVLKDSPLALFLIAKAAERISRYLNGEEEESVFGVFLSAANVLKQCADRKILQNVFSLLREAIEKRIAEGKYEDAARLVVEFQEFGFRSYVKKLLFFALEVSEEGDYTRALRILDLLPESEEVRDAKASILLEWGKQIAAANPEAGIKKIEESLKLRESPEARIALAEVYESIGDYRRAFTIYSSIKNYPGVSRRIARLLMEWGESEADVEKLSEAKLYADDPVLREEIERRMEKIGR